MLWSTPRSMSTTFEKSIQQLPGVSVVHEPFTDVYYFGPERQSDRYGNALQRHRYNRSDAIRSIFSQDAPLCFVKELAFQAEPYLDDAFLGSVVNTFLIRSPLEVYSSLMKLKPDFSEAEFGFQPLAAIIERAERLQRVTKIVDASDLVTCPNLTLREYCQSAGLPYSRDMITWDSGPIRNWAEHEKDSQSKWHVVLENSTGIMKSTTTLVDVAPIHEEILRRAEAIYERLKPMAKIADDETRALVDEFEG